MVEKRVRDLKIKANEIRKDILSELYFAGSGHTAGSLGATDILTVLYFDFLNIDSKKPLDESRDYFILSPGHICPALYATLANRGFFERKELSSLRKLNSMLQGHPHRSQVPGVETSSGPLGSGLSQAAGLALALKNDEKKNRVVCLTSDGEHDEGNHWEAVLFAHKYHLNNLLVFIDRNRIQISGNTEQVMPLGSLKEKYLSFGWGVIEIDGNNISEIISALEKSTYERQKPLAIIANTIPGKGVKLFENNYKWHGVVPNKDQYEQALKELEEDHLRVLNS
ncbi:MAG: transketolase [Candidatus Woesearchaeota archaeon]|jgi:transketolase